LLQVYASPLTGSEGRVNGTSWSATYCTGAGC
jgi:hypothetical protein